MKQKINFAYISRLFGLSGLLFFIYLISAQAQTTRFTYQGRLTDTAMAADGSFDFSFALFDAAANGINVSTNAGALFVKDTSIFNSINGINIAASASGVTASLDNVRLQSQTIGLNVASNAVVSISDSVISQNTDAGIAAADTAQVNAESVKITGNGTGIRAANTSIVRMSNLDIFNNTIGITRTETGVLASFSNNKIAGNGTRGAPTAYLANQ